MDILKFVSSVDRLVHCSALITLLLTHVPSFTLYWVISVLAGKIVKLTFKDFDQGIGFQACQNRLGERDIVEIRDGKWSESKKLAIYCNYNKIGSVSDVYSTGNKMRVTFSSSSYQSRTKGFKARYEASDISLKLCYRGNPYNDELSLNGSSGTLQSPVEKGSTSYPPDSSCDWLITVPNGKIVRLRFDEFELQSGFGKYCHSFVEIRDGEYSYSENKGKFCGYEKPDDIHSSGRYMRVSFRSDFRRSFNDGFKATFAAHEKKSS